MTRFIKLCVFFKYTDVNYFEEIILKELFCIIVDFAFVISSYSDKILFFNFIPSMFII